MLLSDAIKNTVYLITRVNRLSLETDKLIDFGFLVGARVSVIRWSFGKSLYLVKVRNSLVSVRRQELEAFEVDICEN